MRPDWVRSVVREAQRAAEGILQPRPSTFELLATLAERIPVPEHPLERAFASHLVRSAAWSLVRYGVSTGTLGYVDAHTQYALVVTLTEQADWSSLPSRLRGALAQQGNTRAAQIRIFVESRFAERLTLREICRSAGCSVRTGTTAFRVSCGRSIREYLTLYRLLRAAFLLRTTDLKVSAVATAVGFETDATLYRQCKRVLQLTPRQLAASERAIQALEAMMSASIPLLAVGLGL